MSKLESLHRASAVVYRLAHLYASGELGAGA